MPFTLSHPAAVLPLARVWRGPYARSALVVGSMSPDFEYLLRLRPEAVVGHSAAGLFVFCLPIGLLVLALFHTVVKRPLVLLFPDPVRRRLDRLAAPGPRVSVARGAVLCLLVVLGAATHVVWDEFTHLRRGLVERVPALGATAFRVGGVDVGVYKLLQHGSTAAGAAVLGYVSWRWLRAQPPATAVSEGLPDRVRRGVVVALAGASALAATLGGLLSAGGDGPVVQRAQVGLARAAVVAMSVAALGVLVYGLTFRAVERRADRHG
jgi:hypothetical protein